MQWKAELNGTGEYKKLSEDKKPVGLCSHKPVIEEGLEECGVARI